MKLGNPSPENLFCVFSGGVQVPVRTGEGRVRSPDPPVGVSDSNWYRNNTFEKAGVGEKNVRLAVYISMVVA